jgi:hypothetical protein
VIKEWILSRAETRGEGGKIGAEKGNNDAFTLCRPSFVNLFALGSSSWEKLCKTKNSLGTNHHDNGGNNNRAQRSALAASQGDLTIYLCDLGETRGEANATRFVREMKVVGLREEEKGLQDPPPHLPSASINNSVFGGGGGASHPPIMERTHLWPYTHRAHLMMIGVRDRYPCQSVAGPPFSKYGGTSSH